MWPSRSTALFTLCIAESPVSWSAPIAFVLCRSRVRQMLCSVSACGNRWLVAETGSPTLSFSTAIMCVCVCNSRWYHNHLLYLQVPPFPLHAHVSYIVMRGLITFKKKKEKIKLVSKYPIITYFGEINHKPPTQQLKSTTFLLCFTQWNKLVKLKNLASIISLIRVFYKHCITDNVMQISYTIVQNVFDWWWTYKYDFAESKDPWQCETC